MAKLTKAQANAHANAQAILNQEALSDQDRAFVLEHWQESATNINSAAGAFFTPWPLALDFALEAGFTSANGHVRILDLCAGIGTLSLAVQGRLSAWAGSGLTFELVCVELNPEYIAVGRKMIPAATWVEASIFDLPDLGEVFDLAISNPPFGKINRGGGNAPRYTGSEFEYHVIDIAAHHAKAGAFILPQQSAPFVYSGADHYRVETSRKYDAFSKQTGITLEAGCGVDTSVYRDAWHGVNVLCEIVTADFDATAKRRERAAGTDALFELVGASDG